MKQDIMNHVPTLDLRVSLEEHTPAVVPIHLERPRPLHRLGEARQQENLSRSNVARRLGITEEDVKEQERTTTDMPLSMLRQWGKALGLPVAELLEEPDNSLSTPLVNRARLIRVMKTALAILERTADLRTKRLAQTMVDQLLEIMPELHGVSALHAVGKRRSLNELGIAAQRSLSDEVFNNVRG